MKVILLILLTVFIYKCSFRNSSNQNESDQPHYQLYSQPEWYSSHHSDPSSNEKRLVVALTHNLFSQWSMESLELTNKESINKGGINLLTQYVDILRKKFLGEVVMVDSGNLLSLDANVISSIHKNLEFSAMNLGQLDLQGEWFKKPGLLKRKTEELNLPYVISNLYEINSQAPIEWKGVQSTRLIEKNGIKVGFIGLISPSISKKIKVEQFKGLHFDLIEKNVLKYSRYLKRMGAQVIVVMLSTESECGIKMAKAKKLIIDRVNFDPTANEICEESQVVSLIKKMPKDLVDLYLLSGGSTKFANFIDGIPVIRPLVNEKSFSYIELILSDNKINSEKTIIHQPVILCDSFNKASKDCFSLDKSVKLEKSEPATFLDLPIIKQ